ncbi:MAG: hypothetical protein GF370_00670 [Candidatus Nealsonbacteria bacterium]|nr:hypothetical protein [Candidatus Nealsonbacteria bacterium]
MKIVRLDQENWFCSHPDFKVTDVPIVIFNALLVVSPKEEEYIIRTVRRLWQELNPPHDFVGHIRADLVPRFVYREPKKTLWKGWPAYDLGNASIKGIYEFNVRSPECVAVGGLLQQLMKTMKILQPGCYDALAKHIQRTFGDKKIYMIPGNSILKNTFGAAMIKALKKGGVDIKALSLKEAVSIIDSGVNSSVLWTWADWGKFLPQELLEYPEWFCRVLDANKERLKMFNTVPVESLSDKGLLMPKGKEWWDQLVGKNFLLSSKKDLLRAIEEKDQLVSKPREGSEGFFIRFGCKESQNEWKKLMEQQLKEGGYALFEKRWLPKIKINDTAEPITMDLNPSFWLDGKGKMYYLYTIVRADSWEAYFQRGKINVAQGGGVAGNLIVDKTIK